MTKVNVFITVDTEHSIGGAFKDPNLKPVGNEKRIFGKIGDKFYGIPLIMDIAEVYNIHLTFFMEVLNKYYFGEKETRGVCEDVIKRGHDIQLHMHPNYLNFNLPNPQKQFFSDFIGDYGLKDQIELIEEGIKILTHNGVSRPIAFRAGCFAANRETLKALKENGFLIDCSYNRASIGKTCFLNDNGINDLAYFNGIWEFPVTNFIESTKLRPKRFMPLDINGVSFQEMKYVLNKAKTNGPRNITILLHSFSFIKAYDIQYYKVKPRWYVIKRFKKLCHFLNENSDVFEVRTFGSLDKKKLFQMSQASSHFIPEVPAIFSSIRGLQQLKDILI